MIRVVVLAQTMSVRQSVWRTDIHRTERRTDKNKQHK